MNEITKKSWKAKSKKIGRQIQRSVSSIRLRSTRQNIQETGKYVIVVQKLFAVLISKQIQTEGTNEKTENVCTLQGTFKDSSSIAKALEISRCEVDKIAEEKKLRNCVRTTRNLYRAWRK